MLPPATQIQTMNVPLNYCFDFILHKTFKIKIYEAYYMLTITDALPNDEIVYSYVTLKVVATDSNETNLQKTRAEQQIIYVYLRIA